MRTSLSGLFLLLVALAVLTGRLPLALLGLYLALSVVTFFVYALDKSAAQKQRWRRPESHLHLLALLGGWPGALAAQRLLRHKSSKASFQGTFWLTLIVNAGLLAWLLTPQGAGLLARWLGPA